MAPGSVPSTPITSAVLAFAAMVSAAALVRTPPPPPAVQKSAPPGLLVARLEDFPANGALRETMALLDPAPLFLPSAQPERQAGDSETLAQSGRAAAALPPVLVYPDTRPSERLPRPRVPGTPLAAADLTLEPRWFSGLAQVVTADAVKRPPSAPVCRLLDLANGAEIATTELSEDPGMGQIEWPPLEFTVLIDAAGAPLLVSPSAGNGGDEIGERVRELIRLQIVPSLRLRPGLYRALVNP